MSSSKFGYVIGTAMQKTIKVRVEKIKIHPVVKKPVRYHKNFMAHDAKEVCVVGDYVKIDAGTKFSRHKNFKLAEIVRPAQRVKDHLGVVHSQGDFRKEAPDFYDLNKYK